ncbi:MAG: DUF21 domain-containing protein [Deltaproteobacteria bacterium]|nr:DUF21 domain-containing protein [Deltaproteobacteria bacterium]
MAAAVVGGVGLGALLAAVGAGLHALGEAGLQALSETEGRNAKVAQRVLRDLSAVQSRLLIGRVLCVALAAALVGLSLLQYGAWFALLGVLGTSAAYAIVATVAGAVVRQRSGQATLQLWRWLRPVDLLLTPLAVPLRWINELVMKLVPEVEVEDPDRLAELTVEHVIEQGEETGTIAEEHAQMLRSVLEFKNTVAREIMVPRTQMVAFDIDTTIDDVLASVIESGHSRYPVYRGQIDQVEGILYAKDLFEVLRNKSDPTAVLLTDVLRKPVFFAAESQKIGVLLREMQRRRLVYERAPGHYFVDASISVYDLEEHLGEAICDDKTDFDSLGGMLVHLAGQVPVIGATLVAGSYRVVVLEADERHVRRVEMLRASTEEPKSAAG